MTSVSYLFARGSAVLPTVISVVLITSAASAQTAKYSCPNFLKDIHQTSDCIEAIFSETPMHLTFSSVPPGNGMALGGVVQEQVHYVSPFAPKPDPNLRSGSSELEPPFEQGYKSLVNSYFVLSGSTNGSWFTSGGIDWLPPLHYVSGTRAVGPVRKNGTRRLLSCHRLGPLCTQSIFGIDVTVTHRSIQTINFYGLGPSSPSTQFTYQLNETYGGINAHMPIFDWLTIGGGIEDRQPDLPVLTNPLAVNNNFSEATAPGLASQPNLMHYQTGIKTLARVQSEPVTKDYDPLKETPPLMKRRIVATFRNDIKFHWFSDRDTGHYSFRQTVFDGDETFQFGGIIEEYVSGAKRSKFPFFKRTFYDFMAHSCGVVSYKMKEQSSTDASAGKKVSTTKTVKNDIRVTDPCDFGRLDIRTHLAVSNGVVPFYMQPTIGGSDIDSQLSLRGFANYRFRGPDATFLQVEYGIPVWGPLGALMFYDGGNVGQNLSGLSFTHFRQDAGAGTSFRLGGSTVAQLYLAMGAGHGSNLGYNLVKFF
jgi:hypothetical protein